MENSNPSFRPDDIIIRKAGLDDMPGILELVKELAHYERAPLEVSTTLGLYEENFSEGVFDCLLAEIGDTLVGMALYYVSFSTWKGKMMYLEDFIVTRSYRRRGVGKRLFEAFLEECRKAGVQLAKWQVLDWNEPAIQFYKKYDCAFDEGWLNVRIMFGE